MQMYLFDAISGFGCSGKESGNDKGMYNGYRVKQSTTSTGVGLSSVLYHMGALKCVCVCVEEEERGV